MSHQLPEPSREEVPPTLSPDDRSTPPPSPSTLPPIPPRPLGLALPGETLILPAALGTSTAAPVKGYEIISKLGEGGMGIVFKARQIALNRLVALKMIRSGELAQAEDVLRFRHEAEAVAQLEHPNIIRIYDVGEHEGQPCFAMELADAGCLSDRLEGKPIVPHEAARLVETLARAMHHAHLRGIVHRDLKPVNVLLSSNSDSLTEIDLTGSAAASPLTECTPKISDFGLAKRLDSKGRTETGRLLGTVNYMSPEQAEGRSRDVGPRTDIYGLGAILYELLTGRPPFMGDTIVTTLEMVRHSEPVPIRQRNPACPRDLETICLKCLEKDPDRRYDSAQELANDLAHFLAGEPIKARPVSTLERVWRMVQRRRRETAWAGAAALVIVLLMGFLVRQAAVKKRDQERRRRDYIQAIEAIDRVRQTLAEGGHSAAEIEALLRELPRLYEQVQQQVNNPELKEQAAAACNALSEVLWRDGRKYEASEACQRAISLYAGLREAQPEQGQYADQLALIRLRYGQIRADFRDYEAAEREFHTALADMQWLCERAPDNQDYQRHLAEVYHQQGVLFDSRKLRQKAVDAYLESLKIRQKLADVEPSNRSFRRDLARGHGYLGDTYLAMGDEKRAWQAYEAAERIRRQLVEEDGSDADARFQLARSYANEGYFAQWTGEADRSLRAFERARVVQEKLVAEHPEVADYQGDLGWSLLSSAEMKLDKAAPSKEVEALAEQARIIFVRLRMGSEQDRSYARNLARSYVYLAMCHRAESVEQARTSIQKARQLMEQQHTDDPDDLYLLAVIESVDGSLLSREKTQQRWNQADRAMVDLTLAIGRGYSTANRLEKTVAGLKLLWELDSDTTRRMSAILQRCRDASKH